MIYIGIDPGKNTGIAVWNSAMRSFFVLETMSITKAIQHVRSENSLYGDDLFVIFEDARQRKWFGDRSEMKQQGAGSVKRDCSIWEDFLREEGIRFRALPPVRGGTKISAQSFRALTRWEGRTSSHARDAAMLVFGK